MAKRSVLRYPVTISVTLITIGVAIAASGPRERADAVRLFLGTGYEQILDEHRWWTPITSVFLTGGGIELPFVLLAIVLLVGFAERLMGSLRAVTAFVVTSIAGAVAGTILQSLGVLAGELWSNRVSELVTLDPMTAVVGTIMTASSFASALWRRRIRVVTLSLSMVFLLYSGAPSDLYRVLAALAGLGLGVMFRPRTGRIWWHRSSHHETRVLLAAVVAITAIGPAITIFSKLRLGPLAPLGLLLTNASPVRTTRYDDCQALRITVSCLHDITLERISSVGPVLLTVLPLVTLLVAAFALARGRRFGAWLAVTVNVALAALAAYFYGFLPISGQSFVLALPSARYWEVTLSLAVSALVPLGIAALVLFNFEHFTIRASARRVQYYLASIAISLVSLSAIYVAVGWLTRGGFRPQVTIIDLLADVPERFVPIGFLRIEKLSFIPTTPLTRTLYYWIGPCFWLVVVVGAFVVIGDYASRNYLSGLPEVRSLIESGGGGSFAQWATWPGNSYWIRPDGDAIVAYRVINGVALTTSEPIGDPVSAHAAIAEFATFCDDSGWTPVFYSIHESFLRSCEKIGFTGMSLGDETVIRPGQWQTEGKQWQDVRSSISRADREGINAIWTSFDALSPSRALQIQEISEQWVSEKNLPEMSFTLGGLDELRGSGVRLMIACDADDRVVGVISWLPSYRGGAIVGWTLDFMRRTPDGPNGITEFLIARSAERFRDDGIEWMSLSASPLAHANVPTRDEVSPTPAERVLEYVAGRLEPAYGFTSLAKFKRKFQPEFVPLYMAYPDAVALPAIALAITRAYLPSMSLGQSIRFMAKLG